MYWAGLLLLGVAAGTCWGFPAVVGPDEGCHWLEALQLEEGGWLCCANRTLTVQDGRIVGRRRGVTERCDAAVPGTSGPRLARAPSGGKLTPAAAFIVSLGITLLGFLLTVIPVVGLYHLYRGRREQAAAVQVAEDDASILSGYMGLGPVKTLRV